MEEKDKLGKIRNELKEISNNSKDTPIKYGFTVKYYKKEDFK